MLTWVIKKAKLEAESVAATKCGKHSYARQSPNTSNLFHNIVQYFLGLLVSSQLKDNSFLIASNLRIAGADLCWSANLDVKIWPES